MDWKAEATAMLEQGNPRLLAELRAKGTLAKKLAELPFRFVTNVQAAQARVRSDSALVVNAAHL